MFSNLASASCCGRKRVEDVRIIAGDNDVRKIASDCTITKNRLLRKAVASMPLASASASASASTDCREFRHEEVKLESGEVVTVVMVKATPAQANDVFQALQTFMPPKPNDSALPERERERIGRAELTRIWQLITPKTLNALASSALRGDGSRFAIEDHMWIPLFNQAPTPKASVSVLDALEDVKARIQRKSARSAAII